MTSDGLGNFNAPKLPNSKPADGDKKSSDSNSGCLGCFGVIGVLVIIAIIAAVVGSFAKDEPYDPNNATEAKAQCRDLVENALKAPSTAEFNELQASGSGTWTVTGSVDAENSFGAKLRNEFQCTVIVEGDSIKRKLDYLG